LLWSTAWIAAMLCTGKSEPSMLIVFLIFMPSCQSIILCTCA
jgi:hypothetical protein